MQDVWPDRGEEENEDVEEDWVAEEDQEEDKEPDEAQWLTPPEATFYPSRLPLEAAQTSFIAFIQSLCLFEESNSIFNMNSCLQSVELQQSPFFRGPASSPFYLKSFFNEVLAIESDFFKRCSFS